VAHSDIDDGVKLVVQSLLNSIAEVSSMLRTFCFANLVFSSSLVMTSMLLVACGGGGPVETSASTSSGATGSGGSATSTGSTSTGAGGSGGNGSSSSSSSSTSSSSSSSGTGGGSPCGGDPVLPDYEACGGNTFFADGSCTDGSCAAADPLANRAFKEWRKQTLALSGLTAAELSKRTPISTVFLTNGPSSVWVQIEYVVVLDWVRSRQIESIDFGSYPLAMTPSDAQVTQAVKIAIEDAEWTGLGAITTVADQAKVKAAFDACSCGLQADVCYFGFQNVTGILAGGAIKEVDPAHNKCLAANVDVGKGVLLSCDPTPCVIN
jgi:hypothetical protein